MTIRKLIFQSQLHNQNGYITRTIIVLKRTRPKLKSERGFKSTFTNFQ